MKFDYDDCIREGLLRKVVPSRRKTIKSFEKGKNWLEEAKKNLSSKSLDSCVVSSHLAIFHTARAILIRDGFREKSHYCVARYLEEKYVKQEKLEQRWINLLDHYRDLRHSDQYDVGFYATEQEAQSALEFAENFVKRMEKLFKEK
ncbi:MAG: HEPN domain-containing protein [Candidatus Methanofastidiosia archaeon]